MTNQDHDQKKRECFVKFCKDNGIDQEVNISIFDAFDQIFDRAFALGREKETITQEEIEKAAEESAKKEYLCEKCAWKEDCDHCGGQNSAFDCCECPADSYEDGFKTGANFALGKQEIKQEIKQEKDAGINGEEMLTVPKKQVQELLQHCEDILSMMPTDSSASFLKYRLLKFLEANIDSSKPQDFGKEVNSTTKEKPTCTQACTDDCSGRTDKDFNEIIKAGLKNERRANLAATILAGLLAGGKEKDPVRRALELADNLIAEAEKGDQS